MKTHHITIALLAAAILSGCARKAVDEVVQIGPSETAFVVPLDGANKDTQARFKSSEYLDQMKVAAKRVIVPHKIVNLCPTCVMNDHLADVPTAVVYKIDRAPVTREWTQAPTTGTSASNQAFSVESSESIDFDIGATITAHVAEEDAAKFLFYYAGKNLHDIIDTNVRGYIGTVLSSEFGSRILDDCRKNKVAIFATALEKARETFASKGITIDSLGFTEGMTYHDPKIQESINKLFAAQMSVETANQQALAASKLAQAKDALNIQVDLEIKRKMADVASKMADKWDGHGIMPQFVISNAGVVTTVPVQGAAR